MYFKTKYIFPLIFIVAALALTQGGALEIPENFEDLVADLVNNHFIPSNSNPAVGLAVTTTDGSFKFTSGYGLRDRETNLKANNATLFAIASISKSFTATLVSRILHEKFPDLGEGALDVPIKQLNPSLNFTFIDRVRAESMSFRDLLSHKTCVSPGTFGRTMGAFPTAEEYIYRTRYAPEVCYYRAGYTYNNAMFSLAGELIAQINGTENYQTLLSNFQQELGMTHSEVVNNSENYDTLKNMATPYYLNGQNLVKSNPDLIRRGFVSLGSGGVITSPNDMLKYLELQLNEGLINGRQLIPKILLGSRFTTYLLLLISNQKDQNSVMRRLKTPSNPLSFNGYKTESSEVNGDYAYALGLHLGFYDGYQLISHDGFWAPFASRISLYPSLGFGIFSASSGPGRLSSQTFTSLHNAIASILIGKKSYDEIKQEFLEQQVSKSSYRPSVSTTNNIVSSCSNAACPNVEIGQITGIFGNPLHGDLEIVYDEKDPKGNTILNYGTWGHAYIRETKTKNNFLLEWDSDVISDFLASSDTVPEIIMQFTDEDSFTIEFGESIVYVRNATLSTLPEIPWAPGSCTGN